MNFRRHGDLSFHEISPEKVEGKLVEHEGSFVLALGEATGHAHVITAPKEDLEIRQDETGRYFITLKSLATISHEEHKVIEIPAGTYEMKNEREYNYFAMAVQRVID